MMKENKAELKALVHKMSKEELSKWIFEHIDEWQVVHEIVLNLSDSQVDYELSLFK